MHSVTTQTFSWQCLTSLIGVSLAVLCHDHAHAETPKRVSSGLLVYYTFEETGEVIRDRSGVGNPVDLQIRTPQAVGRQAGHIAIHSSATIASIEPAHKIVDGVKSAGEITVEAWIKPASAQQSGPARIVSLSTDISQRNVTLGQDKSRFDVRFRSTATDPNGIPSTASTVGDVVDGQLAHVVFTREKTGRTWIYINGQERGHGTANGEVKDWNRDYRLSLANELSGDRPWQGELHLVAIYGRALTHDEVKRNFTAGTSGRSESPKALAAVVAFEQQVAPILAKHCLECHDSAIHKGGLDLSRKSAAVAGGSHGNVFSGQPGAKSLLDELVQSGQMPKGRPPLSAADKDMLHKWLSAGAPWTREVIDPADYLHESHAAQVWAQRLTVSEYIAAVQAAVGVDIAKEAREALPPEVRADGFSNTAYNLNVDLKHVEAYAKLSGIIVSRMNIVEFAGRFSKDRKFNDDKMRDFIAAMGKWILRGPLDSHEVDVYRGLVSAASSSGTDFDEAVRYLVEAMLQSPRFIYRIENQRGNGTAPTNAYELASRLSFTIWGGPPDAELFQAADRGELADRKKLEVQIQRMLKDPRAVDRSVQFVTEWLNLDALVNLRPNAQRFPKWSPELAKDMQEETIAFFKEIAWKQQRPLADLFNAKVTYASPRLAEYYGFKPIAKEFAAYELTNVAGRGGLLTQGSTLTVGGDDASMVTRGLFVMHDLLRGTVNSPPACVDTTPQPTKAGLTHRQMAEARIANSNCGVCHVRFEPLAFGLERFDGVGVYREKDQHGNSLRDDGEILFPGTAGSVKYKSTSELMNLLAQSQRVQETLTWKAVQFAVGRPLVAADAPRIAEIHQTSTRHGGTYGSLITAIALSDLIQSPRKEPTP